VRATLTTRRMAAVAATAMLALLATACTSSNESASQAANAGAAGTAKPGASGSAGASASPKPTPSPAGPLVVTSPANGVKGADPSGGVTVTATRGTLKTVTVNPVGGTLADSGNPAGPVPGALNAAGTAWHSTWALGVSQQYAVTATATYNGITKTTTSTFSTLTPAATFSTNIFEGEGQAYGVGMPIILTFSQPITNRAAVERAITLTTSKSVVGVWYWDSSTSLAFRPRDYWPSGTHIHFAGHFDGVEGAKGLYGFHTLTQAFTIGQSVIAVASTTTHRTQIYINGKLTYNWPISSGKPGDDTPNGSYLTIEKENPVRMTGPGYSLLVPYSVRFTWSGDYYHDAYWSVGQQGFENVSHGCVNLPPAASKIYYNLAVPGDPITIKNSPKPGTWDNGWTYWFLTWPQLLKGSATHQAVQAGPSGSTFVDASTLPADHATAPLETAASGVWG
jgi:lipoprotein-anchoring transpeptidase ErfK/SrfK